MSQVDSPKHSETRNLCPPVSRVIQVHCLGKWTKYSLVLIQLSFRMSTKLNISFLYTYDTQCYQSPKTVTSEDFACKILPSVPYLINFYLY